MVVGEWWLPAAGQGGFCAGTLGFLLDPGGGAMEGYCGVGQSKARVTPRPPGLVTPQLSEDGLGYWCSTLPSGSRSQNTEVGCFRNVLVTPVVTGFT